MVIAAFHSSRGVGGSSLEEGEGNESQSGSHTLISYLQVVLFACIANLGSCDSSSIKEPVLQCVSDRDFPLSASAGIVSGLQVRESTKGQHLHCYDPFDGKGWARVALLSITCLITPPMMKGSRSNLVIAKSLMSLGLRAARAGCECRSSRRVSLCSYCCTFTGHLSL